MFNWSEIEETARLRQEELAVPLSNDEIALIEFNNIVAPRKPVRSQIAKALIRLSERFDAHVVAEHARQSQHQALVEARMAAYPR